MNMFVLTETKPKRVRIELVEAFGNQNLTKQARDNAVIIAGETLATIQQDEDLIKDFIDLCEGANVVLACRVSPKQKAEIVQMMRARNPEKTTLAIGDGANDVNMINAANIGVGIAGLEGQQATRELSQEHVCDIIHLLQKRALSNSDLVLRVVLAVFRNLDLQLPALFCLQCMLHLASDHMVHNLGQRVFSRSPTPLAKTLPNRL